MGTVPAGRMIEERSAEEVDVVRSPFVTFGMICALVAGSLAGSAGVAAGAADDSSAPVLYFNVDDTVHGRELWTTDGTAAGTHMVADVHPGSGSSQFYSHDLWPGARVSYMPEMLGDTLFMSADDGTHGAELWRSGGTESSTRLVKDVAPGDRSGGAAWLQTYRSEVYFSASDGHHGKELWRSDGTAAGTEMVKDVKRGGKAEPSEPTVFGGKLYFVASDGVHGRELWRTDGTASGTDMVKDINPRGRSDAALLTVVGDTLFFSARDGLHQTELWRSDGTAAGTEMVKDLSPWNSYPQELTAVGATLFFQAVDETSGRHQRRLFASDGTAAGTHSVAADKTYDPQWMTPLGDQVIYSDSVSLWRSDGTDAGTVKIGPGLEPRELLRSGNAVYFSGNGVDLWRTDGTADGTTFISNSYPRDMADVSGTVYFSGFDFTNKQELWRSDGTAAGTALFVDCGPGWAAPKLLVSATP